MENEVKTKVCKKCGQELPLDQIFSEDAESDDTEMTPENGRRFFE